MPYTDYRVPSQFCCRCEKKLDAAAGQNEGPSEGDLTMCAYCGHVMKFDKELRLTDAFSEDIEQAYDQLKQYATILGIPFPRED